MVPIKIASREGFRNVLILFLGLNLAWMETAVNAIVADGPNDMLGWPPFDWYMPAFHWFWTNFVLTILAIALLLYLNKLWTEVE